jgi:N-acetylmuramoyl-L-alanine amidase CwlA
MALWHCAECTASYSVGAPRCPECGSVVRVNEATQLEEEDKDMAKVTVHGGPSNEAADNAEGSEQPSADGSNSSASSETEPTTPEQSETKPPLPARKTASRSKKAQTGNSSAARTDGGPEAATSASND